MLARARGSGGRGVARVLLLGFLAHDAPPLSKGNRKTAGARRRRTLFEHSPLYLEKLADCDINT
jgi:hypothetical protein